ncbi:TK1 [Aratus pisonii nudivirus]|nr:TK1 [Aratus pisonii nudivirus]
MIIEIIKLLKKNKYHRIDDNKGLINKIINKDTVLIELQELKEHFNDNKDLMFGFNLESYMLVFPEKLLIAYISCAILNIFSKIRSINFIYNPATNFDHDCQYIIKLIKENLCEYEDKTYYLQVKDIYLPWNDYILPEITGRLHGVVTRERFQKPLDCIKNKLHLHHVVHQLMIKDNEFIESLKSEKVRNHFTNKTISAAVSINGTACVGKTTLLSKLKNLVTSSHDETCQIEKIGRYGKYKGKDNNQILSLSYQSILLNIANRYPSNLLDRDPFNNLIWRCILQCVHTNSKNLEDEIVEIFYNCISQNLLKTMKTYPIIILIDLNEEDNRRRMFLRNTGGDRKRCYITNYVLIQNVFYSLFAYYCSWPVFDTVFKNEEAIIQLVMKKIYKNKKNPTDLPPLNCSVTFKSIKEEDFTDAKRLKIMK